MSQTSIYILPSNSANLFVKKTGTNTTIGAHWISYNTNKAIVDYNTGKVTALESGMGTQTTVAAYVNGTKVGTCVINIGLKTMAIKNTSNSNSLFIGDTTQLYLTYKDGGAKYPYETHWISYNTSKATVDYNTGVVTGVGVGTTTIAAYVNGNKVGTYSITIKNPVIASISNPNATTVTLQALWEYAPSAEARIFFNLIKSNVEGSSYTFSSTSAYNEAIAYYEHLTGDTKVKSRNGWTYTTQNGKSTVYFVIKANDDNVAYTLGSKGKLVYYQAAYSALSKIGVKNGMSKSTAYQKIVNYVASINTYDYTYTYYNFDSIYDKGTSVCNGYSELIQIMCLQSGIDCNIVTSSSHAWNRVNLGGTTYQSDITWYDNDKANKLDTTYYLSANGWNDTTHTITNEYTYVSYPHFWTK
jgi:transglutaminase/protease-like cytokinesis protein 3